MKKISSNRATARSGVNALREFLEHHDHIFQELEQHNDFGIDGYVEFSCGGQATGVVVAAQVKSGESYLAASGGGLVRGDAEHVDYWRQHVLPVVLIVLDPKEKRSWWCDAKASVESSGWQKGEVHRFVVDRPLDATTLDDFFFWSRRGEPGDSSDAQLCRVLEMLGDPADEAGFYEACRALFRNHRKRWLAWQSLILVATSASTPASRKRVAFRILFYISQHPDIYWNDFNSVPFEVSELARGLFCRAVGSREVVELLSMADEDGFQRGSVGQGARCLLNLLPFEEQRRHFERLAFDEDVPEWPRYMAFWLLLDHIDQARDDPREELLAVVAQYRQHFASEVHGRVLEDVVRTISDTGRAPDV